jgi:hypothetical protein
MLKTLFRMMAAVFIAAIFGFIMPAAPALADGYSEALSSTVVQDANTAIRNAMQHQQDLKRQQQQQQTRQQASQTGSSQTQVMPDGTIAQAPPVSQSPIGGPQQLGLPTGLSFFADASVAYPYGDIGTVGKNWLPGGFDASVGYGFDPSMRLVGSMYQLQHYPVGFNSGTVPVYLKGFQNPVGCADLSGGNACGAGNGQNLNLRTKDTFYIGAFEKLFVFNTPFNMPLPIVITPTYVARTSYIGQSTQGNDVVPFAINPPDGPSYFNTNTRTAQYYSVAVTLPFLKTPKMFGTFTVAPTWLVHTNGANVTNNMQPYQILYLEYDPLKHTQIFFEPQVARDYLPTDQYPQHLFAYFLGVSQHITPMTFFQVVLNSGGPTNEGAYGVHSIECVTVTQCATSIGGLKATQIQLQLGVGSPNVFPL